MRFVMYSKVDTRACPSVNMATSSASFVAAHRVTVEPACGIFGNSAYLGV